MGDMSCPGKRFETTLIRRPPPLMSHAYHPLVVPVASPLQPSRFPPSHYCCSPPSRIAVFCGLRKSLREILSSKHTSSMYSLVPMMYSQADLFYSPRSRRHDGEDELVGGNPAWKGLKMDFAPNPKAHLHFNSAVRQAVEKYSDVLSSMKCHHMENIINEVMRLCPLLRNDITVKNRVKRAVKSYICNAVTHYKRKQRHKSLGYSNGIKSSESNPPCTRDQEPGRLASLKRAPSPDVEGFFGRDASSSSYQDELIDYSKIGRAAPGAAESVSPEEKAVAGTQSSLSVSSGEDNDSTQQRCSLTPHSQVEQSGFLEISNVRSMSMGGDNCPASSGGKAEGTGFQFSNGPSLEELRSLQADFAKQRDWDQFHQPRNLLLAMIAEVGEVSELFQWRGECKVGLEDWSERDKKHLGQELSDVLLYLIRLADKCQVDLSSAVTEKLGLNAKKYPVHKAYGSSKKYTEYD